MCEKQKYDCRKRNYKIVRKMASQFPKMIQADVRLFFVLRYGIKYYDFEPADLKQHIETTLEIFKK